MFFQNLKKRWPGYLSTAFLALITGMWAFWGSAEMYYEGWGTSFSGTVRYLIPVLVCMILASLALTWPKVGGWVIIVLGTGFTAWWWGLAYSRGWLNWRWALSTFPVSGILIVIGALFILVAKRRRSISHKPAQPWWRKNLSYLLVLGIPLLVFLGVSIYYFPILITRVDDGERGARLIEGHGVKLIWAPQGPGWNWKQPWGGYPSWNSLAFYGVPPLGLKEKVDFEDKDATLADMQETGLCRYLNVEGTALMDAPQKIWRMPTVNELVSSLTLHGENAGCVWDREEDEISCQITPDKETPLWAPDEEPIYYWAADEDNTEEAYYVGYNGNSVSSQGKWWGNPRHGYRCVKEE